MVLDFNINKPDFNLSKEDLMSEKDEDIQSNNEPEEVKNDLRHIIQRQEMKKVEMVQRLETV